MAHKNRSKPARSKPTPVVAGNTFAVWLTEVHSMVQELDARRRFDADVGAFLRERGLTEAFEAFRDRDKNVAAGAPKI